MKNAPSRERLLNIDKSLVFFLVPRSIEASNLFLRHAWNGKINERSSGADQWVIPTTTACSH